jgi:DeoR/GlpR family transcriptional regulator of sugar metabolism
MAELLAAERRDLILEALRRERKLQAVSLAERFGCSPDTIRRDLDQLAAEGLVKRVHGGALPLGGAVAPFAERRRQQSPAKEAVARAAAALIPDDAVVLLDGGTTCLAVTRHLPAALRATVFTTSPPVAEALAGHPGVRAEMLGGHLSPRTLTTVGPTTVAALATLRPDLCLLGPCGLHPDVGVTVGDPDERAVKAAMIAAAAETVALATADKLGTVLPYVVAELAQVDRLVVELEGEDPALRPYADRGLVVVPA